MSSFVIKVDTTPPVDALTTTIFDSTVAFGPGGMRHLPIARISFGVNNSHAFTLVAEESTDGGVNWRPFSSTALDVPAANTIGGPIDYLIDVYYDVRLRVVNGGTTQTTWEPMLKGHETRMSGA